MTIRAYLAEARQRYLDFDAAQAAMDADHARRRRDGGPWVEDEIYYRLNDAVGDTLDALPWWLRAVVT